MGQGATAFYREMNSEAEVLAGLEKLKQRGLLRVNGEVNVLDAHLLALAPPFIVEQTLPSARQHRLAPLEDMPTLIERLLAILPVQMEKALPGEQGVLTLDEFVALKAEAEREDQASAKDRARAGGLSATGAESLVNALAAPQFGGNIALLKIEDDEAEDARNLALVQGSDAAWLFKQTTPGANTFDITTTDGLAVRRLLVQWLAELTVQPAA